MTPNCDTCREDQAICPTCRALGCNVNGAFSEGKAEAQVWETNTSDFSDAISEFETSLPGFWWSVGQCSVGAHASCAVDGFGPQANLLEGIEAGHPYDDGFHVDTIKGSPAEALRAVLAEAVEFMKRQEAQG